MIKHMYRRIYKKLESNAALRDNDKLLQIEIWRDEGFILSANQERKFMSVTSPETIRRTRQKIQSDGHFRPGSRVLAYRQEAQQEVKAEVMHDRIVQSEMFSDGKRFPA